ncbi:MAG: hypothetical protein JW917_00220 [Ignavibacteria bacterium]|nr:hypothetical protein [Ignavibacteria bacterium]
MIFSLFISIGWYNLSDTFFYHSHEVNGKTVHHSHPYSKGKEHTHSEKEFLLILEREKTLKLFLAFTLLLLFLCTCSKEIFFYFKNIPHTREVLFTSNTIRAPSLSTSF